MYINIFLLSPFKHTRIKWPLLSSLHCTTVYIEMVYVLRVYAEYVLFPLYRSTELCISQGYTSWSVTMHTPLRGFFLCRVVRETGTDVLVPNVRVLEPCSIIQSFNSGDDGALSTTGRWTSVSTSSTQCSPCDAENTAWVQEVLKRELDSKVMRLLNTDAFVNCSDGHSGEC
jgi:hypothetical protein